jgi:lysophospholipase L1-like esterase
MSRKNSPTRSAVIWGARRNGIRASSVCCCALALVSLTGISAAQDWKFDFTAGKPSSSVIQVAPTNVYSSTDGWGFDLNFPVTNLPDGGVGGNRPFFFSVRLPAGNYRVSATFGDLSGTTTNTVKAEARRLMLENLTTTRGEIVTRSFTVNTRSVSLSGQKVRLKPRERTNEVVTWDDKLTLEFNGARPVLRALEIAPATNITTVFLAGDSTVCDQPLEPWNSWGQMLPRFFDDQVAVANYAESGESIVSSLGAHRFDKVFSLIQPGDFLFVQFGHNDMKDKATNALAIYRSNLRKIVAQTRAHGATPVLVTSMERKAGVKAPTLAGYPDAVREVAREEGVALIDLNAASLQFYRALGPDLDRAFQDGTHHNNYGSYELARCVVEGIRQNRLDLVRWLAADVPVFNPAKPDNVKTFHLPESPLGDNVKPEGN